MCCVVNEKNSKNSIIVVEMKRIMAIHLDNWNKFEASTVSKHHLDESTSTCITIDHHGEAWATFVKTETKHAVCISMK